MEKKKEHSKLVGNVFDWNHFFYVLTLFLFSLSHFVRCCLMVKRIEWAGIAGALFYYSFVIRCIQHTVSLKPTNFVNFVFFFLTFRISSQYLNILCVIFLYSAFVIWFLCFEKRFLLHFVWQISESIFFLCFHLVLKSNREYFHSKNHLTEEKKSNNFGEKKSFSISSVHIHFVFSCEFILFIGFFHQIYFLRYLVWFYYWILWDNLIWQKNKSFARIAIVGWLVSQLITFTWLKILQWKGKEMNNKQNINGKLRLLRSLDRYFITTPQMNRFNWNRICYDLQRYYLTKRPF